MLLYPEILLRSETKLFFVNGKRAPIPLNINYVNQPINRAGAENPRIFPSNSIWNEDNYGPIIIRKRGMS